MDHVYAGGDHVSGHSKTRVKLDTLRRAAGCRDVHIWLLKEDAALLDELGERWGLMSVRDTIIAALRAAEKTTRGAVK